MDAAPALALRRRLRAVKPCRRRQPPAGMSGPARPGPDHWFEPLADHLGSAYLRYSFTKGTAKEVDFLVEALGLEPGQRVLDVGCGPGRHALALAERGIEVRGVDISQRFVELARRATPRPAPRFERLDARELPFDAEFDAVISLCQGAFGLAGAAGPGRPRARRSTPTGGCWPAWPGPCARGRRWPCRPSRPTSRSGSSRTPTPSTPTAGVNHERTADQDEHGRRGRPRPVDHLLHPPRAAPAGPARPGSTSRHIWSVTPGAYAPHPPDLDHPEFLLRRPPLSAERRSGSRCRRSGAGARTVPAACRSMPHRLRLSGKPREGDHVVRPGTNPSGTCRCDLRILDHGHDAEPPSPSPAASLPEAPAGMGTFAEDGSYIPRQVTEDDLGGHVARRRLHAPRWSRSRTARSSRAPSSRSTGTRSCSTSATSPRA